MRSTTSVRSSSAASLSRMHPVSRDTPTPTLSATRSPMRSSARRAPRYVGGPTVSYVPHAGHARMAIVFDLLRRHLMWRGFDVFFVRNVTDVDDKIIAKANELGVDPAVVAERFTQEYDDVMR